MLAVETNDLSRRYGPRWALVRANLRIEEGERFLIVGANGSGKTTLLRVLSTALPRTRGDLKIFGRDPDEERRTVRHDLALLSHLPAIYEELSGVENLRIFLDLMGRPDEAAEPWLERVGLEVRPDPIWSYSAGMKKRLSFARMLSQKPRLALIDEPYGQLDPAGFGFVDDLLTSLSDEGTTVIVASHQVNRARHLCHNAMLLHSGQTRWTGPAERIDEAWDVLHTGKAS